MVEVPGKDEEDEGGCVQSLEELTTLREGGGEGPGGRELASERDGSPNRGHILVFEVRKALE